MEYDLSTTWTVVLVIAAVWEMTWKGFALWRAGRNNRPGWFVALLVVNTVGILPIFYLLTQKGRDNGEN